jgi:hypothetical protein
MKRGASTLVEASILMSVTAILSPAGQFECDSCQQLILVSQQVVAHIMNSML